MVKGINKTYRYLDRYRQIAAILIKYGFKDFLDSIKTPGKVTRKIEKEELKRIKNLTRWERLRLVFEELGPTFIKFGQIMSNRPDLLPEDLITELEKLQDSVPPFPGEEARDIIREELGNIDEYFSEFDVHPYASASIAQVHKAILRTGEQVVVKVRRPNIEKIIEVDLEIMTDIAYLMNKYIPNLSYFDPSGLVENFEKIIRRELDFSVEGSNVERFYNQFQKDERVKVPAIYKDLTTKKIVTLEFIDGIKINNIQELNRSGLDLKLIANRGFEVFLQQVFEFGFFHGDPHPGNLLVLRDHRLCFLDYGMMGFIMEEDRDLLTAIMVGLDEREPKRIIRSLEVLSGNKEFKFKRQLEKEIGELVNEYYYKSLEEIRMQDLLNRIRMLIIKHQIKVPPDFFLLIKSMVILEGIGRKLNPEFNALKKIKPIVTKLEFKRFNPLKILRSLMFSTFGLGQELKELPYDLKEVIERIKKGEINVDLEHKGIQPLLVTLDKVSNRIAFSIVLAAMILGSSLIVLSGIPPKWNGIPLIGLLGYVIAGLMGLWLLYSILRHRKM